MNLSLTESQIARLIDHTLLKPEASRDDIQKLCDEALDYGFASVCVNPVECFAGGGIASRQRGARLHRSGISAWRDAADCESSGSKRGNQGRGARN